MGQMTSLQLLLQPRQHSQCLRHLKTGDDCGELAQKCKAWMVSQCGLCQIDLTLPS